MDAVHLPDKWDVLVANVGHHAAAGAEHWTLEEYRRHVDAFLDAFRQRFRQERATNDASFRTSGGGGKFVWLASHAMPTARDNQIATSGDWRTNQRLALYERFARERVLEMQQELGHQQWMYQDAFNLTLPYIEAAAGDCGHFTVPNVQMALVQQFLNLICPVSQ